MKPQDLLPKWSTISHLLCQEAGHGCGASAADADDMRVAAETTSVQWTRSFDELNKDAQRLIHTKKRNL